MTRDQLDDLEITTSSEFEAVLTTAVREANHAGVDVCGAWEFEARDSPTWWEVEIFELHRTDMGE